jgi:hypothetical protein
MIATLLAIVAAWQGVATHRRVKLGKKPCSSKERAGVATGPLGSTLD